jgi:hypothetical protein
MSAEIIAFPDPIVVLKAKWDALDAECDHALDYGADDAADAISRRCVEIEDRIAALVPKSVAGAAVQVWLLQHMGPPDHQDQIIANLITGLDRIERGTGNPAAWLSRAREPRSATAGLSLFSRGRLFGQRDQMPRSSSDRICSEASIRLASGCCVQ